MPPPEVLLPGDTIAVLSVPDVARTVTGFRSNPLGRLWASPGMEPFRSSLIAAPAAANESMLSAEALTWLDKGGQLTLGLLRNGWEPGSTNRPALVALLDGRGETRALRQTLGTFRQRLVNAGCAMTTRSLRGCDFMETRVSLPQLLLALGSPDTPSRVAGAQFDTLLLAAEFDSVLLAGTDVAALERIMDRLEPGATNALAEQPRFKAARDACFQDAAAIGWLDLVPVLDALQAWLRELDAQPVAKSDVPMPKRTQLLESSGLTGLRYAAAGLRVASNGCNAVVEVGAPVGARTGLLRALELQDADASIEPWVPADTHRFQRTRLDLRKALVTIEQALSESFPQLPGVLRFLLQSTSSGAEKIDLHEELLSALGDDIVSFELHGTETNPPAVSTVYQVASTNAGRLFEVLQSLSVLLPSPMNEASVRESGGQKILELPLSREGTNSTSILCVAAGPRGLLAATDLRTLQRFLRTNAVGESATSGFPGLAEAAREVGGMSHGLFRVEDLRYSLRGPWERWRSREGAASNAPAGPVSGRSTNSIDLRLLPPFDAVRPYFGLLTVGARTDTNGFIGRAHLASPVPAALPVAVETNNPATTNSPAVVP